jgi:hypothetical protein
MKKNSSNRRFTKRDLEFLEKMAKRAVRFDKRLQEIHRLLGLVEEPGKKDD